jgi:hypothetical protein
MPDQLKIEKVRAPAFTVPTKSPESDGTLKCDATTLVLVPSMPAARLASVSVMRT